MATEMISLRFEKNFLKTVDATAKKEGFVSRTDFIRQALREKMVGSDPLTREDLKAYFAELRKTLTTPPITEEQYRRNRDEAAIELFSQHNSSGLK